MFPIVFFGDVLAVLDVLGSKWSWDLGRGSGGEKMLLKKMLLKKILLKKDTVKKKSC